MCEEMPVILVNRVVYIYKKRILGINGGPMREGIL
jgi:hypothetical protein